MILRDDRRRAMFAKLNSANGYSSKNIRLFSNDSDDSNIERIGAVEKSDKEIDITDSGSLGMNLKVNEEESPGILSVEDSSTKLKYENKQPEIFMTVSEDAVVEPEGINIRPADDILKYEGMLDEINNTVREDGLSYGSSIPLPKLEKDGKTTQSSLEGSAESKEEKIRRAVMDDLTKILHEIKEDKQKISPELRKAREEAELRRLEEEINADPRLKDLEKRVKIGKLEQASEELDERERMRLINEAMGKSVSGFTRGLYEHGKQGFVAGATSEIGKESARLASGVVATPGKAVKGVVTFPGKVVSKTGRFLGDEYYNITRSGRDILAPAALAFGTTAGRGVSGIIAETGDIIEAPKREFWTPPGMQKVWTGSKYETRQVLRPPLEPWSFNRAMGLQQPMGVSPAVSGVMPVSASDVSLYGAGSRSPNLWGRSDLPVWGGMEMVSGTSYVPKIAVPDFYNFGKERVPKWIVPPNELVYGVKKQEARSPIRGGLTSSRSSPSISVGRTEGNVPSYDRGESVQASKMIPQKIAAKLPMQRPTKDVKQLRAPYVSSNVMRVEGSKRKFDELSDVYGSSSPEAKRQEAVLQSQYDYARDRAEPGSYNEFRLMDMGNTIVGV